MELFRQVASGGATVVFVTQLYMQKSRLAWKGTDTAKRAAVLVPVVNGETDIAWPGRAEVDQESRFEPQKFREFQTNLGKKLASGPEI